MNRHTLRLIVIFLFFTCQAIKAQDQEFIYGKVVDKDTNAIFEATVYWDVNDKDKQFKQLTQPDATFSIPKLNTNQKAKLIIQFSGKETVELPIKENSTTEFIHIFMKNKGVTSVTASRWEQSIYEIPASTIIISREEIEQNGYLTLQEILENVPGLFTIDQRYASGPTIGIRGFWTDFSRNVMIQLNGINMLNDRRNDFPLDKINVAVESIDKIEIVRGPMSVIYGDGAFFGVINIITNTSDQASSSSFTTGYGTQNTIKQTLRYALNENGLNLSLNAMTFQRDGFNERWDSLISPVLAKADSIASTKPGFRFPNAVTLSDYYYDSSSPNINPERYSKNFKAFNMSMSYNGFFSNINFSNSNSGFSYKAVGPGERNDYTTRTSHYQFGYRNKIKKLGNGLDWQFKTEYMTSRGNQVSSRYIDTMLIVGEDQISSIRTEFNTRYSFISEPNSKFRLDLISGLYYNYNFENGTFYNAPDINLRNWYVGLDPKEGRLKTIAGYAQFEAKIKKLQIIGGLRISQQGSYKMLNEENVGYYGDDLFGYDLGWENDSSRIIFQRQNEIKPASQVQYIPRLAAIYNFKHKDNIHYLKAMYGKAVNEINVVQNAYDIMRSNDNLSDEQASILGGKYSYLAPEEIQTIEFSHTIVNNKLGFDFNTNIFYNVLNNLITRQTYQIDGVYKGYSANDENQIVTRGIEFIGKQNINLNKKDKLIIQGGVTLQSTKSVAKNSNFKEYLNDFKHTSIDEYYKAISLNDTNDASTYENNLFPTSFSPPILANFNATFIHEMKNGRLILNVGGNYVGPMWSQGKEVSVKLTDGTYQKVPSYYGDSSHIEVNGYWRFSLNIRVDNIHLTPSSKGKSGGLFINLKFCNLLNQNYKYPNHSYTAYFDKGILGRGRQVVGNVGYKF